MVRFQEWLRIREDLNSNTADLSAVSAALNPQANSNVNPNTIAQNIMMKAPTVAGALAKNPYFIQKFLANQKNQPLTNPAMNAVTAPTAPGVMR